MLENIHELQRSCLTILGTMPRPKIQLFQTDVDEGRPFYFTCNHGINNATVNFTAADNADIIAGTVLAIGFILSNSVSIYLSIYVFVRKISCG